MDLSAFNVAAETENSSFRQKLLHCCGSKRWAAEMCKRFPVRDVEELYQAADAVDSTLTKEDWLESFAAHPRVCYVVVYWTFACSVTPMLQATKDADKIVLDRLDELNDAYYKKFGYIYIVCATGKSAPEMMRILESRMKNSPEDELSVAAGEQSKITKLRLEKLLQE
ncbi:OHCU decarboxylase [Phytophthora megakarya]|uniref:2-oxo-4-hydroxy-4-carboxy-5-ureidoimidazoline decarboxylase n=1 Tax=Phytophthora megakarya TaxID=4795 RepID=A0A225V842_9STRA|nr:OHCU decarboxylase [Phytophthora megakarya]